jgi:hypothetical protein
VPDGGFSIKPQQQYILNFVSSSKTDFHNVIEEKAAINVTIASTFNVYMVLFFEGARRFLITH